MAGAAEKTLDLSDEEYARRGDEIYERAVVPLLTAGDMGKFVAIDVNTETFEVDPSDIAAVARLREREPGAAVWLTRAGRNYAYRFGAARADQRSRQGS